MAAVYRDYAAFLAKHFDGKVQKISIDAGFSCPNRDGTIGRGGCIYCNVDTFSPAYCRPSLTVEEQIERGRQFFARKYPRMQYLAYFQAYTGTHDALPRLADMYARALDADGVAGIIIGTRPDCIPEPLLDTLERLSRRAFVMLEFGAESAHDSTLRAVNRCHTWAQTVDAVRRTRARGIPVGLHLIMGLPGETEEMMLHSVDAVSLLRPDTVKFHHLQVVRHTALARGLALGTLTIPRFTPDTYADLCCRIVARLHPSITIERFTGQTPADLLVEPRWGLKNYQFATMLANRLAALSISQGCQCPYL